MQHAAIAPDAPPTAPVASGRTDHQSAKGALGRDSMDSATIYETIETFGLTETAGDLPIPQDDVLRDRVVSETFEVLLGGLQGTGLHGEIEPLAHGLASLLHRRKQAMADALQKTIDTIRGLIRAEDGSEVITLQIEEAQTRAERLRDLLSGLEIMAESVARASF